MQMCPAFSIIICSAERSAAKAGCVASRRKQQQSFDGEAPGRLATPSALEGEAPEFFQEKGPTGAFLHLRFRPLPLYSLPTF